MNSNSLTPLRVLVTRPEAQQAELCRAIEAAGGTALRLPLIRIDPLQDPERERFLSSCMQDLDRYQLLLFVSSNAAREGAQRILDYWPQFPIATDVFAIGPTTAATLNSLLDCAVQQAPTGMTSEDLLDLPRLQQVSGQRIGIFRGVGGREILGQTLEQRGATVDRLEVYRRTPVDYPATRMETLLAQGGINVATVHSGESLDQLIAVSGNNKKRLTLLPLLVPSQRLAVQAAAAGFCHVIDTKGADAPAYVAALQEIAAKADKLG